MRQRSRIGIIPGDPGGIGPELIARLLHGGDAALQADILLIGDAHVFGAGQNIAGLKFSMTPVDPVAGDWQAVERFALDAQQTIEPDAVGIAEVTHAGGQSTLKVLDRALELAQADIIDGFLFGPFNKAAMHLAGLRQSDELHYMADRLQTEGYHSELNVLDGIWTSRVTSHVALRDVPDMISAERIGEAVRLIDRTLRRAGIARPRISVAALNPHAGDGGNFGREEIEIIRPAVESLQRMQMAVDGPWPSDTVFRKVFDKSTDAIVTMYHDQGQIALKLLGFDRGVSVLGGLPIPVTTPAHGTAFDIAGKGTADAGAIRAAFSLLTDLIGQAGRL
ncbi:MAG: 4-hydroxythreonine-4-phosphate dehydrogenase PdxA [Rhodobacteraceae bacterium]|nr:4-hydroxythreonine-4-phosphate dehydrogenase PdxA [Paracoccaceae bacterium]